MHICAGQNAFIIGANFTLKFLWEAVYTLSTMLSVGNIRRVVSPNFILCSRPDTVSILCMILCLSVTFCAHLSQLSCPLFSSIKSLTVIDPETWLAHFYLQALAEAPSLLPLLSCHFSISSNPRYCLLSSMAVPRELDDLFLLCTFVPV